MAFSVTLKNLAGYAGATNLQLFLRNTSDNSLLNAGGDTGSDPSSIGSFTWTVAEDRPAEQMLARIYEGTTETAANIVIDSVLNVGFTEIGTEAAALDSSALDPVLEAIEALESASGTWTEEEKAQIRYRLGLDGTATAPEEPAVDPIVITPATGIMTTGYLVTRVKGVATAGITIYYQHVQEPTADRGSSYDDTIYSAISNSEGIAELSLVKGGLYYIWRSSATRPKDVAAYRVVKADGTTPDATLALPSHIGH